jgi:hypothetical protein
MNYTPLSQIIFSFAVKWKYDSYSLIYIYIYIVLFILFILEAFIESIQD